MKAKFTVFIALATMGISFSSCKRYYDCQCTSSTNVVTKNVVNAPNKIEANKKCKSLDLIGNCELQ